MQVEGSGGGASKHLVGRETHGVTPAPGSSPGGPGRQAEQWQSLPHVRSLARSHPFQVLDALSFRFEFDFYFFFWPPALLPWGGLPVLSIEAGRAEEGQTLGRSRLITAQIGLEPTGLHLLATDPVSDPSWEQTESLLID